MRKCPKCKLVNPDVAERCDCGYDFATGDVRKSYIPASFGRGIRGEVRAFSFVVIGLVAVRAVMVLLAGDPRFLPIYVVWAILLIYLARQFEARKRWARTGLAMLTLPLGLLLFSGRYSRYLDGGP